VAAERGDQDGGVEGVGCDVRQAQVCCELSLEVVTAWLTSVTELE
jgi:hypothetical protein